MSLRHHRVALIFLPLAALAGENGHMSVELLTQVFCDEWSRRFVLMGTRSRCAPIWPAEWQYVIGEFSSR